MLYESSVMMNPILCRCSLCYCSQG